MISGAVPFEEIVQSVKDETGIENIRPFYEKIKRLIFRAEREIGYGGSVALMKKTYSLSSSTNNELNRYFKYPDNFIELEGVGRSCQKVNSCEYVANAEGIRFLNKQVKRPVLLFWGIDLDVNGYPIVTRNHEEAVIAYIVWKFYTQKIFLGIGNMNANQDYKQNYHSLLLEARGDDAFPTEEEMEAISVLNYTDRRILINNVVVNCGFDYCEEINEDVLPPDPNPQNRVIKYFQNMNSDDVIAAINEDYSYLDSFDDKMLSEFENGVSIKHNVLGRAFFAILKSEDVDYNFQNVFNQNVNNAFDSVFISHLNIKMYFTKNILIPSDVVYKIELA